MEYEIRYDPDADVLSIILRDKGELSYAEECGNLVIHMDKEGRPLLIEVLRARDVVKEIAEALSQG